MAEQTIYRTQLRLNFENGIHPETGNVMYKRKMFNNMKTDATPEQLFAAAHALAQLQTLPLDSIERIDSAEVTEQ